MDSNTDYSGVLRALERKMKLRGSRVLIFGAGGSARAAAFAVLKLAAEVFVSARRDKCGARIGTGSEGRNGDRAGTLRKKRFDVIVNATPVGMHPNRGFRRWLQAS